MSWFLYISGSYQRMAIPTDWPLFEYTTYEMCENQGVSPSDEYRAF